MKELLGGLLLELGFEPDDEPFGVDELGPGPDAPPLPPLLPAKIR